MRTAGLPTFRKLYAAINYDLQGGSTYDGKNYHYTLYVDNTYQQEGWTGKKKFVLSTSNSLGGKNYFLGVAFIVVGCLCLTLSVVFFGVFMSKKNSNAQQTMTQNREKQSQEGGAPLLPKQD